MMIDIEDNEWNIGEKGDLTMKMIDVLNLVAEGKIKDGTKMIVIDERGERYKYVYMMLNGGTFVCNDYRTPKLAKRYPHSVNFLNLEAELID